MKERFLKIWVAITAILMAGVPIAMAVTPAPAYTTATEDKGEFSSIASPGQVSVEAGNITFANITSHMPTPHWAGIYGHVNGTIVLGDANSNKMYEWDAVVTYVIFDDDQTIDWNNLDNATCTDIGNNFTWVADSTGVSDSCSNTFKYTGSTNFYWLTNPTNTVYAKTWDNSGAEKWKTYAILDTANADVFFAAEVDTSGILAYNGESADYQAILPENGESDTTATPFYVWIELY